MVSSEQRRRQLAREKYERQQTARAEAASKAKRRNAVLGAALAVVVLAGGGAWAGGAFKSDSKKTDTANAAPNQAATPNPVAVKGCTAPSPGQPNGKQWKTEPAMAVDATAKYNVTMNTSCGAVTLQLDPSKAPHTVNSFVFLAGQNYFDHTKCHRLTTSSIYVLQCGDPTGTGSGTPGYSFTDENLTGATYPAGTVAMANSGANTNGSQFFLVYKDTQLPPSYTPFGKITGGLDVLNNIAAGGVQGGTGDGAPNADVVLNSVTATKG
ncbi:peptidylprolyl isomerase [Kitasatospora sp. GAS204B]|uniref:peptidylprolyl isomerase n=1 Tax=unclassified Kitasatospora TaxID=2633591 RepID=UPI002476EEB9|nr:peptidylprolyl isomerase [Kitasatospora sp. GAS204B]